jgi:hypothetical protein
MSIHMVPAMLSAPFGDLAVFSKTAPPSLVAQTVLRGIFVDARKCQIGSGRRRPIG